ncbi:SPOR domain-containing protein [Granulosicoccus antarcticus]|uniref:SPOR domain-containing protein n=1 Tax=Granulosicoccus antarcticus IMCC3135 TaxID=1192854 RepID=A0A2Z2P7W6_9GAMM|nr:SPOR domain-containing protein [Granulosicoccus antarcticus]ASJ75934.1 hypothetical protein IMCC3135_29420 [Granulosicoccus antarcticus IMCC3135]
MLTDGAYIRGWRLVLAFLCITFGTQAFTAPAQLQLENELLLELRLDGERLDLDVLGYQRGEEFLVSLNELANGLGFLIAVDAEQGLAEGWYISEDRFFSLDLQNAVVVSDGQQWPISEGEAVMFEGELYVETKALEKWFPLRLSAVIRELYLNIEADELLPIQKRTQRRKHPIGGTSSNREAQFPLQETPYRLLGPHTTKLRLGFSSVRQTPDSRADYGSNYALLSRGDLGWMTSTISLSGQSEESLTGARLKLERTAFDGPLGLNHVEVGDVSAGGGRGLLLRGGGGRNEQSGRFDLEVITLEGSQLPDWDVELYQNGQLITIQTTGQDGRYVFEDLPLQFGENRFELKFFGPFGETESREEVYFLGLGMLAPGGISYEMSAVESGRTVFGLNDGEGESGNGLFSGGFNFGLSRNLTVGAGVTSREVAGERLESSNARLGISTSRFYGNVNYVNTPGAQSSVSTSLSTRLGITSLNLGYTQYFDEPELASSPQKWQTSIGITSSVFDFPVKFKAETREQENSTAYNAVIGTTTTLAGMGQFSSSLWYSSADERLNGITTRTSLTGGQSNFRTVIKPWSFRLSTSYDFEPETELIDLSATGSLSIDRNLSLDLDIRHDPRIDTTYYAAGINWVLDHVVINARVGYDSDERWVGLINLSTTLAPQPGTLMPRFDSLASVGAGAVEVRVFEDENGAVGQPYAGVDIKGVQAWRRATTDERGLAYLSRMPAHRQVDIQLEEATLADTELRSRNPGVSVIPRPGSYAVVDFPIIRTVELEGHVVTADGDEEMPVSRALVSLKTLDGAVVAQRRSAFDGFFLFDGIEPGDYQLSLEDALDGRVLDRPDNLTVLSSNGVIRGLDFTLRAIEEKAVTLGTFAQKEESQPQPIIAPVVPVLASAEPEVEAVPESPVEEGSWFVQLGAYGTRDLAQAFWNRVSQGAQAFEGKTPRFEQYQNMTRLLVGPGQGRDAANQLCQQLQADSLECLVRSMD